jgi:hypothetical protein
MLKLFTIVTFLAVPAISYAAELSPWMGNDGQVPFQLDPNTMVAVTFAADPLQTGSISKPKCNLETCLLPNKTAKTDISKP